MCYMCRTILTYYFLTNARKASNFKLVLRHFISDVVIKRESKLSKYNNMKHKTKSCSFELNCVSEYSTDLKYNTTY